MITKSITMTISEIVKEQIQFNYPNSNTLEKEIIGLDIKNGARLYFHDDNSITLKFQPLINLDINYIRAFFGGRIPEKNCSVYTRNESISIYTRYTTVAVGVEKIIRSMDIFENFQNLKNQYSKFLEIIVED